MEFILYLDCKFDAKSFYNDDFLNATSWISPAKVENLSFNISGYLNMIGKMVVNHIHVAVMLKLKFSSWWWNPCPDLKTEKWCNFILFHLTQKHNRGLPHFLIQWQRQWHETLALKCTHMLATWGLWLLEDWGFVSVVQWAIGMLHLWDQWNQEQHPQHRKNNSGSQDILKAHKKNTQKAKQQKSPNNADSHTHTKHVCQLVNQFRVGI